MNKKNFFKFLLAAAAIFGVALWGIKSLLLSSSTSQDDIWRFGSLNRFERKLVKDLVINAVYDGFAGKKNDYPDLYKYPANFRTKQKVYTTFNLGNNIRGRGKSENKPLPYAIAESAYNAAFLDSRFPDLSFEETADPDFNFYVSVLYDEKPLSFQNEQDIIQQLKPFQHGLALTYHSAEGAVKQAILLPNDWLNNPEPQRFWLKLKEDAGLAQDFFSEQFQVYSFSCATIRDLDFMLQHDAERIRAAIRAFQKLFQPDGHVQYEINFATGEKSETNHIVREMGSGYALAYAYYLTGDETLLPALVRFFNYVNNTTVVYQDGVLVADNADWVASGASALALLGVLYYEQKSQDTSFQQLREGLKNGLTALFEPGTGVHRSPWETETSPYYDGETWLALSVYNIFHPEDEKLAELIPLLNQTMYYKYSNEFFYQFFHWGTQAAAFQFAQTQSPLMHDFLNKQLNIYIDTIGFEASSSSCSYAEGLAQAATALRGRNEELYLKVAERLENQTEAIRLLQDAAFQAEKDGKIYSQMKPLLGLFLNGTDNLITRNDVTQHCLSALLKAQKVMRDVP